MIDFDGMARKVQFRSNSDVNYIKKLSNAHQLGADA
jgi:hypothetical protein